MVEQTGESPEVSDWESAIERLQSMAGTRELLLAAVAICRELRDRLPNDECRQAIEAVARLADHPQALIRNVAEAAAIATAGTTEGPQWDAALRNQVTLFQKLTDPKN